IEAGKNIVLAIIAYFVGRWIFIRLRRLCMKIMIKKEVDLSLRTFLSSLIQITTTILLIVIVIGILGVDTSSFIALFASAGVAIGMALSGTLQNFAGGVMILLFKPFKVGDSIEFQGFSGTVKEMQIFNTLLLTLDNQVIFIPNGGLATGTMKNFSREEKRRIQWQIGISYGDDYEKAKAIISRLLNEEKKVLKDHDIMIALSSLDASQIIITFRVWVKNEDYWTVYYSINEKIYDTFPKENLHFPFPQMDVHLIN
ncbi:MAG: mechanosensitive ion channel, partial [Bacteroidales bacterium]|nr:mechanosensitive ion channel [Bacteroidales bacterium]